MALDTLRHAASRSTQTIMLSVLLALLPGTLAMTQLWGSGVVWNIAWLVSFCVLTELLCCGKDWRGARRQVSDLSACVTAVLIALCLPPGMPIYVLAVSSIVAVALTKHAYGGLGRNVFNPAMVGFAIVLVSFPEAFTTWPPITEAVDVLSGATQLSEFRYRQGTTVAEFTQRHDTVISAQAMVAGLFFLGGLVLLALSIISWHIPIGCLIGLALASLFGYDQGSSTSNGSISFHLLSGGFVIAMFFVATDPVTHPRTKAMQVAFGVLVGALTYLIRAHGIYPDGIAFAILLANCTSPLLDRIKARSSATEEQQRA